MGVCLSAKQTKRADFSDQQVEEMPSKPPLKALKALLVKNLALDDTHHFTVFARYHFWNSYRRSLQMCQKNFREQENHEEIKFQAELRLNIQDGEALLRKKGQQPTPLEDNMLMATWLDGALCHQNENDVSQSRNQPVK